MRQEGRRRCQYQPSPREMTDDSRKVNQSVANRVDDQFGSLVNPKSIHHIGTVDSDGIGAEVESGSNFLVRFALHDHLQDFEFTRGECGTARRLSGRGRSLELRIEHGFAVRDAADSRSQLKIHGIFQHVTACAGIERLAHQRLFGMHAEHQDQSVRMP